MSIYLVHGDNCYDFTCSAVSSGLVNAFKTVGCRTMSESEFVKNDISVNKDDALIILITLKNELAHQKLQSLDCKKFLYSNDESKRDQQLFRTQLEFMRRHDTRYMINTYPSKRNLEFLKQNDIKTITLPVSGYPRMVDVSKKDIDVIVCGQYDRDYYPIRQKIFDSLLGSDIRFAVLPHSGLESSRATHDYHGEKFFQLLDRCWLGVTCRAGSFRDRLLPKYVEYGFSKVLPIGDCPTYMSDDMSLSMLKIDESMTNNEIVTSIKNVLSDKTSLVQRIEKYSAGTLANHNMTTNVGRVISMINGSNFDS